MAYLQTEPRSGTYAGFNPFSDPVLWEMRVPGGIKADGRLSMARVVDRLRYGCRQWKRQRPRVVTVAEWFQKRTSGRTQWSNSSGVAKCHCQRQHRVRGSPQGNAKTTTLETRVPGSKAQR
jgi:hypothetical protein